MLSHQHVVKGLVLVKYHDGAEWHELELFYLKIKVLEGKNSTEICGNSEANISMVYLICNESEIERL